MIKSILIAVLFFFQTVESKAAKYFPTAENECSALDLRDIKPLPIRDQRSISWCFAHSAADYLQYTFNLPEQVSAADIAINYADSDLSKTITFFKRIFSNEARTSPPQTGFIYEAVKKILPQGYCPESILPSGKWTIINHENGMTSDMDVIDAIKEMYVIQKKIHSNPKATPSDVAWSPQLNHLDHTTFFEILKNSSRNSLLSSLRSNVCAGERKPFPSGVKLSFKIRNRKVFRRINQKLDQTQPISIDFFSGIFEDYDHYKRKIDDLHTVLLYGRKFDPEKNECTYLMKNSYGTSCDRYDPKIKCDGGYLWFPESALFHALTSDLSLQRR
jgi:hypothetical protein